jgi:hypothetical protein
MNHPRLGQFLSTTKGAVLRPYRVHRRSTAAVLIAALAVGGMLAGPMNLVSAPQASADTGFSFTPATYGLPAFSQSPQLAPVMSKPVSQPPGNNEPAPLDLVTVQPSAGTVTVHPNNGDGTFGTPITTTIPGGASNVVVADFNHDGIQDIAVQRSADVAVLFGDGTGHFSGMATYAGGFQATNGFASTYATVTAADVNNDGRPDIILGEYSTDCCNNVGVEVLLNNGDGTFGPPHQFAIGNTYVGVFQLKAVDMNGDGNIDLVSTTTDPFGGHGISVQLGNGDGTFQPAQVTSAPWPRYFDIADMNGDKKPDVVTSTDFYNDNTPRQLAVYLSNGDGTFQPPALYDVPLNSGEFRIVTLDGNGDGFPDVAVASPNDRNLTFFKNATGNGVLEPAGAAPLSAHTSVGSLIGGDLNGDQATDLISLNNGGDPGDGTNVDPDLNVFLQAATTAGAPNLNATFGTPLTNVFPIFTNTSPTGVTATINWGDGTVESAPVSFPQVGVANISGTHTYWIPDSAQVTVTIYDSSGNVAATSKWTVSIKSRYLAMGDSYSSGEGATSGSQDPGTDQSVYINQNGTPADTDSSSNNMCHRSTSSYGQTLFNLVLSPKDPNLSFDDVACSGAIIDDFTHSYDSIKHGGFYPHTSGDAKLPDTPHNGEGPQQDHLGTDVSLVTLSVGGNDLGFVSILHDCIFPGKNDYDCLANDNSAINAAHAIKDPLVALYRNIKNRAPGARIMVVGYPRFFPANISSACDGISSSVHLDVREMQYLNDRIRVADNLIRAAVEESGVAEYVDVYNALNGHELCSNNGDQSQWWMNGLILKNVIQQDQESFHPNPNGHAAEYNIVSGQYLNSLGTGSIDVANTTVGPGTQTDVPISVPKSNFDGFTVWASWNSQDRPTMTLYDPLGQAVTPTLYQEASGSGSTYAYFHLYGKAWQRGNWRLHVDDSIGLGFNVTTGLSTIRLRESPLANFVVKKESCSFGNVQSATLDAKGTTVDNSLRYPSSNKIAGIGWEFTGAPQIKQSGLQVTANWTNAFSHGGNTLLTVKDTEGNSGYYVQNLSC